jgi:AmmeMemoRadiSam system protein B
MSANRNGLRQADKAGSWYPADGAALAGEVDECVRRAKAQYGSAMRGAAGAPVAVAVPHAGLFFSGAVAAAAFELVRERLGTIDTFVVFGACHRARLREPGIWAGGAWRTPLGDIEIDAELAEAFIAGGLGAANTEAHRDDNAIELQTPFIKRLFPDAKMVPVAMGFFPDSWRLGERAATIAARRDQKIVAVASTDLTHYGASFGIMPAGTGQSALDWVRANDDRFIDAMVNMDVENIVPVAERDHSACGAGAAAAAAGWAKANGCTSGQLLARTDSYEVMPQGRAEHVVGYAAIAYFK